jgi:TonB family protein
LDVPRAFAKDGETTTLSKVFEARKRAEQSRRVREAVAATTQSPDSGSSGQEDAATSLAAGSRFNFKPDMPSPATAEWRTSNTEPEKPGSPLLGLTGERRANDWHLRWNRGAVVNAMRGCLSITDGTIRKQVNLDSDELKIGSIVYTPVTDDVVLRFELISPDSTILISESVRLVGAAGPSLPFKASAERTGPPRIARSDAAWATATGATIGAAIQQEPIVRSLLRSPRLETLPAPPRESDIALPSGTIEPAVLILRRNPVYPAIAERQFISGHVEVHFCISPEGRVYDAKSVKGSPILARAAIEAVEAWRYEPARRNGTPVDSQASTNFDFKLN